jgi:hypothetical protein
MKPVWKQMVFDGLIKSEMSKGKTGWQSGKYKVGSIAVNQHADLVNAGVLDEFRFNTCGPTPIPTTPPPATTKERLWFTLGGEIVFQRPETDNGFDAYLSQTKPTFGRSRLQSAGLHPATLVEPMQSRMFSTEQNENKSEIN